jgi:RNA recognition motif-containing protein
MIVSYDALLTRYVGNVNPNVTENLLIEVFQSAGLVERCKLIRKEKVYIFSISYSFKIQTILHKK